MFLQQDIMKANYSGCFDAKLESWDFNTTDKMTHTPLGYTHIQCVYVCLPPPITLQCAQGDGGTKAADKEREKHPHSLLSAPLLLSLLKTYMIWPFE